MRNQAPSRWHRVFRRLLREGDLGALCRRMGWDDPVRREPVSLREPVPMEESDLRPVPLAVELSWSFGCV